MGDDNQDSGNSSNDNNDRGGGDLQNVVYQNGDVNLPHDLGHNKVNAG